MVILLYPEDGRSRLLQICDNDLPDFLLSHPEDSNLEVSAIRTSYVACDTAGSWASEHSI